MSILDLETPITPDSLKENGWVLLESQFSRTHGGLYEKVIRGYFYRLILRYNHGSNMVGNMTLDPTSTQKVHTMQDLIVYEEYIKKITGWHERNSY